MPGIGCLAQPAIRILLIFHCVDAYDVAVRKIPKGALTHRTGVVRSCGGQSLANGEHYGLAPAYCRRCRQPISSNRHCFIWSADGDEMRGRWVRPFVDGMEKNISCASGKSLTYRTKSVIIYCGAEKRIWSGERALIWSCGTTTPCISRISRSLSSVG